MSESERPSVSPLILFGSELRRLRTERGYTIDQLAEAIAFSPSLVGSVERAARRPGRDFAERCEETLALSGELLRLLPLITKEASPKWFRPWTKIEEEALTLRTWEPLLIPGLLQTERYARAVLKGKPGVSADELEQAVDARLQRQAIFDKPDPPMFSAILDEGVLHRPIGGPSVMREQLEHLLKMTTHFRVTIQIVPLTLGVTTGLLGGFIVAHMPNAQDAVYFESSANGHVTDRTEDLRAVNVRYDTIRAWAHPLHVTEDLIRETVINYDRDEQRPRN
ncbi:helix-turn-helix domain-containing protein [Nonomuraea endophytica]|uniref:helix-turn-helix domain-containing protein n=1 Tax=Nonomuraea endophytica TaxID=714136 RepID=UPI0037C8A8DE